MNLQDLSMLPDYSTPLLGKEQGVEYDKVFYTDKDGVEHEVKKEEPYH